MFGSECSESPGLEEGPARVFAEGVAHRAAHLADRRAVAQRVLDRIEQVAVAVSDLTELRKAGIDGSLVPGLLERLEALDLATLRFGIHPEDLDLVDLVGD